MTAPAKPRRGVSASREGAVVGAAVPVVHSTARTRARLTIHQTAVLARLERLSETVYYSAGSWVPEAAIRTIGSAHVLRRLVEKGLAEATEARGPLGNVRAVYRPLARKVDS